MSEPAAAAAARDGLVEAVIIAGGLGTRMLPLTERRPKHLLEVAGVPFLEHQLTRLAEAGVGHVVLATSYQAGAFRPLLGDGARFGLRLSYVTEDQPRGTGGAIRNVAGALAEDPAHPVVILNGDVLSDHDLTAQLDDFRRPRGGRPVEVSLHLVRVPDPRAFGCVPTDGRGRVQAFLEKTPDPVTDQVNAGCYVFRRDVVDRIPTGRVVSVERETFPALLSEDALVVGFLDPAYWRDVGSPEALVAASADLVRGRARSPAVRPAAGGALVAAGARVHGEVSDGSSVLAGAVVGAGAVVRGSVLMPGARVDAGALVVDSVLGPGARVGERARLAGVALGDDAVVPSAAEPPAGTRVPCGTAWRP